MTRRVTICLATLTVMALTISRSDGALVWQQEPVPGQEIQLKFKNWEEIVDTDGSQGGGDHKSFPDSPGDQLRGIIKITSIEQGANTLWGSGFAGQELTGYFWGYTASAIANNSAPSQDFIDFIGGFAKIFIGDSTNPATDFDADYDGPDNVLGNDGNLFVPHGNGFDDGELWLDLRGEIGEPAEAGSLVPPTLVSRFSNTQFLGTGDGFFHILGGTGASLFVPDAMDPAGPGNSLGFQDIDFDSRITPTTDGSGWPATSDDPLRGIVMPEPASISVWGLLAFGAVFGRAYRRRRTP